MTQDKIIQTTSPKHVKAFLLSQLGVKVNEIATLIGADVGHVYRVLREYRENPVKAEKAKQWASGNHLNGKSMPFPETENNQLI